MKKLLSMVIFTLLLVSISFSQKMNIHTINGTDVYNLMDIDSITFEVINNENTVTDIDGNVYQTVKIGNQMWMAENLKVTHYRNGESISHITDGSQWANLTSGACCVYDNNNSLISTYGLLYNWYAVNDNRNIAPAGWHIPTDEEWKELEMYLGMSQSSADGTGYRGSDEGGKLKEEGTTHWSVPNTGATNSSGFSALPGGYRSDETGNYFNINSYGNWWSSTAYTSVTAWYRTLKNSNSSVYRSYNPGKQRGYSVRCIKD